MKLRPVDDAGDILPVLSGGEQLSGPAAVSRLIACRLNLFAGDWWENPAWGNELLRMLGEGRLSEADAQALSVYLSSYVRETAGVRDVRDVRWAVSSGRFSWSCSALTEGGAVEVRFEI